MPLAVKAIRTCCNESKLFSTTQAAEKGVFTRFDEENRLTVKKAENTSRISPDRYKVYLARGDFNTPANGLLR